MRRLEAKLARAAPRIQFPKADAGRKTMGGVARIRRASRPRKIARVARMGYFERALGACARRASGIARADALRSASSCARRCAPEVVSWIASDGQAPSSEPSPRPDAASLHLAPARRLRSKHPQGRRAAPLRRRGESPNPAILAFSLRRSASPLHATPTTFAPGCYQAVRRGARARANNSSRNANRSSR